ncbi:MAG TPA: ABC transporter permease [Firmicutes bacterium]|nr:ABC transporter permease [Bacillota bacterium]
MRFRTFCYFWSEALRNIRRNVNLISLGTIAASLFILGAFFLIILNLNHLTDNLTSRIEIRVFLKDGVTARDREALKTRIWALGGIKTIDFISKEEGLKRLKEQLGDDEGILTAMDFNPLPDAFSIKVAKPESVKALASRIARLPGVESVNYGHGLVERLFALVKAVWVITLALSVIFISAIIMIIGNTIRLTLIARRREVEIMKLVGATDWFIRWPFLLEGMLVGLTGAIVSAVALYFLYGFAVRRFMSALPFIPVVTGGVALRQLCIGLLAAGATMGAIASVVFLRKYLRA